MVLSEHVKSLLVFVFYGLLVALLMWGGYVTAVWSAKIGKTVGSVIGGVVGIAVCVVLWIKLGRKWVDSVPSVSPKQMGDS